MAAALPPSLSNNVLKSSKPTSPSDEWKLAHTWATDYMKKNDLTPSQFLILAGDPQPNPSFVKLLSPDGANANPSNVDGSQGQKLRKLVANLKDNTPASSIVPVDLNQKLQEWFNLEKKVNHLSDVVSIYLKSKSPVIVRVACKAKLEDATKTQIDSQIANILQLPSVKTDYSVFYPAATLVSPLTILNTSNNAKGTGQFLTTFSNVYCLTAAHVLRAPGQPITDQPNTQCAIVNKDGSKTTIVFVADCIFDDGTNGIDVGIAFPPAVGMTVNYIEQIGVVSLDGDDNLIQPGIAVQKNGLVTGHTNGTIDVVNNTTFIVSNIGNGPFCARGDSGSAICDGSNRILGVLSMTNNDGEGMIVKTSAFLYDLEQALDH
eukprot:gene8380-10295_t